MVMLDYSGLRLSTAQLHEAKASGATGMLRYLSAPVPATSWKRCTRAEAQQILGAGLDLILNWEWYEGRCLEGAAAGTQDAAWALAAAREIGYPRGATIYVSHDTSARNDVRVLAYLRAFSIGLRGYYRLDVYSGIGVVEMALNAGLARYGWQTIAWSLGVVGRAHLYQNGKQWFNGSADENTVRARPLGSWNETLAAAKPVATKPVVAPKPTPAPVLPVTRVYTVRAGDSLSKLALTCHTTIAQLVRLNRTAHPSLVNHPSLIIPGWHLTLPGAAAPAKPAPAKFYTVGAGDTLSTIAARHHTDVKHLVAWNRATYRSLAKDPDLIRRGWHLRIAA